MKKIQNTLLILIFVLFAFLHFYELSTQEFKGDESAPMLLIDRMWDSIPLRDPRFLGYPFLFYNEPYRSIFSGTLLHFFGPNKILLRLPGIFFGFSTFWLLVYIFKKEKITPWLIILSMISYAISPIIINDRDGGGDPQTRFFFLLTGYLIWIASRQHNAKILKLSLVSFTAGALTMLDNFALIPGMIAVFWKKRSLIDKKILYLIIGTIFLFCLYFSAWLILPYLAYKSGFQHFYDNRGLFYYFSRVGQGISTTPFGCIQFLIKYTGNLFTVWITISSLIIFKIRKYVFIFIVGISAWAAVFLLKNSTSHVLMYSAFFFLQAVFFTDYLIKKYLIAQILFVIFLTLIITINANNLFINYFQAQKPAMCLDNSVLRLYTDHNKTAPQKPCEPQIKQ